MTECKETIRSTDVKMTSVDGQMFSPLDESAPSSLAKRLASLNPALEHPSFNIHFDDLAYSVPDRRRGSKRLLSGLSGTFSSHQLTAIMGPSGAGKSTLLNIIAGYKSSGLSGTVTLNGVDRSLLGDYRKAICYIMQQNQLTPHLSVYEAMHMAANLKLGSHCSRKDKSIVVDEILETLGLVECRDTRSVNLSGGQRKRLSIALELVNNPPIIFLDEPTSGLDSASCFQCVSLLQSLARGGRTVVCSVHQPSARLFEMFDHLYVLADGQCLYEGDVPSLLPFLASLGLQCPNFHNPADYVIEVAVGEHGDVVPRLVNAVKAAQSKLPSSTEPDKVFAAGSLVHKKVEESLESFRFPRSHLHQFWILWKRTLICTYRDLSLCWVRFWAHLLCGLLFGILYYQIGNDASKVRNNSGCIFFALLFLMFTGLMPTLTSFPMERNVFMKEYINHWYSLTSYYLAKTLADLPFQIVFSTMYISIIYFMSSQPAETYRFGIVLVVSCLISMVAQSLGIVVAVALDVEKGVFIGPVINLPLLLFAGFFMDTGSLPWAVRWLSDISYIRYGFDASMSAIYGFNRSELHCPKPYCSTTSPSILLEEMSIEHEYRDVLFDCSFLLGFFFFLRFLGVVLLKLNIYRNT